MPTESEVRHCTGLHPAFAELPAARGLKAHPSDSGRPVHVEGSAQPAWPAATQCKIKWCTHSVREEEAAVSVAEPGTLCGGASVPLTWAGPVFSGVARSCARSRGQIPALAHWMRAPQASWIIPRLQFRNIGCGLQRRVPCGSNTTVQRFSSSNDLGWLIVILQCLIRVH